MVLGRALLWAYFDEEVKSILPPAFPDHIQRHMQLQASRLLPEGENPVKKCYLSLQGMKTSLILMKFVEALMMQILTSKLQGDKWRVKEKNCSLSMDILWHYIINRRAKNAAFPTCSDNQQTKCCATLSAAVDIPFPRKCCWNAQLLV
jgi:hypothetical protein